MKHLPGALVMIRSDHESSGGLLEHESYSCFMFFQKYIDDYQQFTFESYSPSYL